MIVFYPSIFFIDSQRYITREKNIIYSLIKITNFEKLIAVSIFFFSNKTMEKYET